MNATNEVIAAIKNSGLTDLDEINDFILSNFREYYFKSIRTARYSIGEVAVVKILFEMYKN